MKKYKTCESVCKGHPDKLCDIISDSILDACLTEDVSSRVACEVMATKGKIIVSGEITCSKKIDIKRVVRNVLLDVGYNPRNFLVLVCVHQQSTDIARCVDKSMNSYRYDDSWYSSLGAGDQGTVYGYATDETRERLPLPLVLSHAICEKLDLVMRNGAIKDIGPDGKAQVTIEYEDDKPKRIKTIIVSVQHDTKKEQNTLRHEIISQVLCPVFERFPFDDETEILINPSGRFVDGGPCADTGLTGRKLMVDTYGGLALHGGGAFSGKDPTKVDRSAAYMARAIARNIVWCGYANKCQIAISYAIGKVDPVAIDIETFSTNTVSEEVLKIAVLEVFNLRPAAIIEALDLRRPIYSRTASYGHFSDSFYLWEWLDKSKELEVAVRKYVN